MTTPGNDPASFPSKAAKGVLCRSSFGRSAPIRTILSANHCGGRLGSISIGNIRNGAGAAIDATPENKDPGSVSAVWRLQLRPGPVRMRSCIRRAFLCRDISSGRSHRRQLLRGWKASCTVCGRYSARYFAWFSVRPSSPDAHPTTTGAGTFGDSVSQLSVFGRARSADRKGYPCRLPGPPLR